MDVKKLERSWKALWFGALSAFLGRASPELPDWSSGPRRILFLRPDGIGDAIVSTALLRSIVDRYPDLEIDVLASPANASFIRSLDYVRHTFIFNKRERRSILPLARRLRQEKYDAVIDPRVIAPSMTGLMLMLATGAPHRFGVGGRGADGWLTTAVPLSPGHITETLSGFSRPFGLDPESTDRRPEVPVPAEARQWASGEWGRVAPEGLGRRLLVNVSAGEPPRTWPDENFIGTIDSVAQQFPGIQVVVVGAPNEQHRVQSVAAAAGAVAVSTPTLAHLAALVAEADVVFTPDTSVVHIASAFRKPTVAMYLEGTARQWGSLGVRGANLESCDGTLRSLPIEQVLSALKLVLQEAAGRLAAPEPRREP